MISFLNTIFLLCSICQTEPAAEKKPQEILDAWANSGAEEPVFSQVIMALVLVIALIFITLYIVKRFFSIGGKGRGGTRLRILDSLPLGGKRMVQVLKVFDRTLVIGVTGERIDLLTELSDEEVPSPSLADPEKKRGFGNILPLRGQKAAIMNAMKKAEGKGIES